MNSTTLAAGRSRRILTLALLAALTSPLAQAAPGDSFEEAIEVQAGVWQRPWTRPGVDTTWYKFQVFEGEDIDVYCTQIIVAAGGYMNGVCVQRLVDPSGTDVAISWNGLVSHTAASAGDWRVQLVGPGWYAPAAGTYDHWLFIVELSGHEGAAQDDPVPALEPANSSGSSGSSGSPTPASGGAFGWPASLLLALIGSARARRRTGAMFLGLPAFALSACGGGGGGSGSTEPLPPAIATTAAGCIGSLAGGGTQVRSTSTGRTCQANGEVETNCVGFDINGAPQAIDGSGDTYAQLLGNGSATLAALAQEGVVFPAGSDAGALLLFDEYISAPSLVIATYLGGVPQESQPVPIAPRLQGKTVAGDAGPQLYTFKTALAFDEVEIEVNLPGAWTQEVRVYEFCSRT